MFNNDLVYYQKGGKVKALGYTIENALLEKGMPVLGQSGGGHPLVDLVVPAGLLLLQQTFQDNKPDIKALQQQHTQDKKNVEVIGESLFDKLLQLASIKQKKKRTQRRKRKRKKSTRRRSR